MRTLQALVEIERGIDDKNSLGCQGGNFRGVASNNVSYITTNTLMQSDLMGSGCSVLAPMKNVILTSGDGEKEKEKKGFGLAME